MRILSIPSEPVFEVSFLNAGKGPGDYYVDRLQVLRAEVDGLPDSLDAVVGTGDLQGRQRFEECPGGPPPLLGEVLPQRLASEILPSLGLACDRSGALLAGDFFTVPALDRRGGSGDVTDVWQAFADCFAWVAGVPGNHDSFGATPHPSPRFSGNLHYLDFDRVVVDGLRIAGLGGIIGNPRRPHRRTDFDFAECLQVLLDQPTDILVLHDGPDVPELALRGTPTIRLALEGLHCPLVVRGHAYWEQPLAELSGGMQVLNVDSRVVIMRNRSPSSGTESMR